MFETYVPMVSLPQQLAQISELALATSYQQQLQLPFACLRDRWFSHSRYIPLGITSEAGVWSIATKGHLLKR
jgi:hypothetical protein